MFMPTISKAKKDKIAEQILHYLFSISPEPKFTSQISAEVARDEEFIKDILIDLEKKNLITLVNKNKSGISYSRRQRWRLSSQVFDAYSKMQSSTQQTHNNNLYNSGLFDN